MIGAGEQSEGNEHREFRAFRVQRLQHVSAVSASAASESSEKTYILHGVEANFRVDGRARSDYRPMELESNLIAHAYGSARLRLANTDVLVAIKLELDEPFPNFPDEGKLDFFVDCSANATPAFEGRGGEDLATEISNSLHTAFNSMKALDLTKLCIYKGKKCWKMYIDVLLLECGGNLYDAVSLAVKAALHNAHIPKIRSVTLDGNNIEIDISENISDCQRIDVTNVPVMVTLCKIGEFCIVDPSNQEEACSNASLLVSVSENKFTSVLKIGVGSFHPNTLIKSLTLAQNVGLQMNKALMVALIKEESTKKNDVGFLY